MIALLLAASLAAAPDLRLDYTRESLVKTVRHYRQYVDGREVAGGERIEVTRNGVTRVVYEKLALDRGDRDRAHVLSICDECVYVNVDGEARLARREIVEEKPLEPHAIYRDAVTGEVLRDDALFSHLTAKARVFDVNPVTTLNDPTLRDRNDAASAVPDAAYTIVDVTDLDPAAPLSGPNARIAGSLAPHADATQSLFFDRSQPQFEEVNAYFQIDRTQRYLQSLGYVGAKRLVDYAIPIDPHASSSDNSLYVQQTPPGHGKLLFGDGGTDDAEDPAIMLHEFFHAVQDWIAPGALAGPSNSQVRAISEGSADYWAFSSGYAGSVASGRDPYCIADWDARCGGDDPSQQCGYADGADCLRRVDSTRTMSDYNNSNESGSEYDNAAIWSSALREVFEKIGKAPADRLVIESLFGIPPNATFRTVARNMLEADAALHFGANTAAICGAMSSRGILNASECSAISPRGEWTYFSAAAVNAAIPDAGAPIESSIVITDARTIDRVAVRVDIDHPVRGDLVITLVAPNGTEVLLKSSLDVDRTPGVHATFGIDAQSVMDLAVLHGISAAGTWKLRVQDVFAADTGMLQSWSLVLQFAGDVPAATRPTSNLRHIIAVVSHIVGQGGVTWTSDVRLFNRTAIAQTATLIFTPSEHDGTTDFAALKFVVAPQQVVTIVDVVAQMQMLGSGQLEIQGDVVASSRLHGGGYELFPALDPRNDSPTVLLDVRNDSTTRTNLGFAETSGRDAFVSIGNAATVHVPPFGHVQIVSPLNGTIEVNGASVIAYASIIENATNDAVVEIARDFDAGTNYAPVISAGEWRTEVTSTLGDPVVPNGISLLGVSAPAFGRILHGSFAEALPFASDTLKSGDLVGVESSAAFRTNIVLANIRDTSQSITLTDYDASGQLLHTQTVVMNPKSVALLPLTTPAARVHADGDALVYASVIDNSNGDPMLIPLQ